MSFENNEHERFREFVALIMKKRGQSKKANVEVIDLAMSKNKSIAREDKFKNLDTFRTLTEGKLFLEVKCRLNP